jgi:hypothetical protein
MNITFGSVTYNSMYKCTDDLVFNVLSTKMFDVTNT